MYKDVVKTFDSTCNTCGLACHTGDHPAVVPLAVGALEDAKPKCDVSVGESNNDGGWAHSLLAQCSSCSRTGAS